MDMNQILQQAQQMQQRMAKMQEQLAEQRVEAESGGGMVKVVFNGRQELVSLTIDRSVVNPEEVDLLEDLVAAAIAEGHRQSAQLAQQEMKKITGGLPIPGLF